MSKKSLLLCAILVVSGPAVAQTTTPPAKPDAPVGQPGLASPNVETPPGGIPRGVVPAPRGVDPDMVAKPPANTGTMPVIPPPASAK